MATMATSKSDKPKNLPARSAGRPAGRSADEVRGSLLQAARDLFLKKEFRAVSVRQIAEHAGVNPAMVNYYFDSKQGLYLAMVDDVLQSLQGDLQRLGEQGDLTVAEFTSSYCRLLARNPWWPNFLVREVLFSDGEIREAVLAKFASVFAPQLLANIIREQASGHYRRDLDPRLTLLSLMGMTVFPFLAGPALKTIMNMEMTEELADDLATHNTRLFLEGVTDTTPGDAQS